MADNVIADVDLVVRNVRFGFLAGYRPFHSSVYNSDRYSAEVIVPPTHEAVEAVQAAIRQVAQVKFGDRANSVLEKQKASGKLPIAKGDIFRDNRAEYKGNLFLRASNDTKGKYILPAPRMMAYVGPGGSAVEVLEDNKKAPYAGCWGDLMVRFWGLKGGNEGVFCNFLGACFRKDDTRLGGGVRAATVEFGVVDGASADEATPGGSASSLL